MEGEGGGLCMDSVGNVPPPSRPPPPDVCLEEGSSFLPQSCFPLDSKVAAPGSIPGTAAQVPHEGKQTGCLSTHCCGAKDSPEVGQSEADLGVLGQLSTGSGSSKDLSLSKGFEEAVKVLASLTKLAHNQSPEGSPGLQSLHKRTSLGPLDTMQPSV